MHPKRKLIRLFLEREPQIPHCHMGIKVSQANSLSLPLHMVKLDLLTIIQIYIISTISKIDMKPPAPLLTKMACSSISDFFCKPLYPDALIRSREILRNAQRKHEVFKDPVVIQGFKEADQAHSGQVRYLVLSPNRSLIFLYSYLSIFAPIRIHFQLTHCLLYL